MPVHLIFLFLFQSGLAFAFSFFIAKVLLDGVADPASSSLPGGIRLVRNGALGLAVVLAPLMYVAYYNSLPEGKPATLAAWPAAWIFMILAAVAAALETALSRHRKRNPL